MGWKELEFYDCHLVFKDIQINPKAKSSIKKFDFNGWGTQRGTNWDKDPHRFQRLIQAISKSDIKNSLESIVMIKWGISKEDCKSILKSSRMDKTEVNL